jgi:hypothetical protein
LIKDNHEVVPAWNGRKLKDVSQLQTVEECASKCSENANCTVFSYSDQNASQNPGECLMFTRGTIKESLEQPNNRFAGLCPKVLKAFLEIMDFSGVIKPTNLMCSVKETTKLCQFPFKYQGYRRWESVTDDLGRCRCFTGDIDWREMHDHTNVNTLDFCRNCSSVKEIDNLLQDKCLLNSYQFSGFPLWGNIHHTNEYKSVYNSDDCQKLCQKTRGCFYFSWKPNKCWLKWGMGIQTATQDVIAGPKYCPGKSN